MKYLVTGASGFAGRHVIRQLRDAGHEVTGLVRRGGTIRRDGFDEVIVDLRNGAAVNKAVATVLPEGIFHLAAPETSVGHSWKEPETTIEANLGSTLNVLGAARRLSKPPKVLCISSAEVLGSVEENDLPQNETAPVRPQNPYAASKAFDEQVCAFYAEHFGIPIIVVRSFNYVGPGQRTQFVIPRFASEIARLEKRGKGRMNVGNLDVRRDFTDVRDMAAAYIVAMEKGVPGEAYHAGSGRDHSIDELLEQLLKESTATIDIVSDPSLFRQTDIPVMRCDNRKLRGLGWTPTIPLDQTLRDVLEEARQTNQRSA